MGTLNFGVFQVKKFKFSRKYGVWRNGSTFVKVQIFGERIFLMKCDLLYGGLSGSI